MIGNYRIIAFTTCRIQDRENHELIYALCRKLSEINCRLFVYNCSSIYNCSSHIDDTINENDPQTSVYEMFDASFTDAVIVDSDHIGNPSVCSKIVNRALGMKLPVIS
ncbi:MAG: hypothetical protein K2J60_17845, partial [Acetatifactor sp.]|nr:hypothetical protein [Acetatifactor sp.]